MREIKFRSPIIVNNEFTGWHYWGFMGDSFNGPSNDHASGTPQYQFTGLKDKNGVDCYFGDICKYRDNAGIWQVGVITAYSYFAGYIKAIGGDEEGNQDGELHLEIFAEAEVTGNIYEHSHLLKED